jgi:hypothetical protein
VDGKRVSADVRGLGRTRVRDLLIERLSTGLVHRGRARSRGRVELGQERGGVIDPVGGLHEPVLIGGPASLHTGLELRHRALAQQRSHLAIGGRHQGWGELPAPRRRSPGQPGNEPRIRALAQVGAPVVNDVPRCPRRPSDLSQRNRMISGRRTDRRRRVRSQPLGRIDEDLQTRLGALTPPPNAHQHPGDPIVTIDVGPGPNGYLNTIAHPRNPRTTPFAWSKQPASRNPA